MQAAVTGNTEPDTFNKTLNCKLSMCYLRYRVQLGHGCSDVMQPNHAQRMTDLEYYTSLLQRKT